MGPLGWQETVFIFVLALLIFGPKKLPELGKNLAKGLAEFRRASNELKSTFDREMKTLERENESLKEVTHGYYPDSYNYDHSSYDSGSYGSAPYDSTANALNSASASAPQGAESTPGTAPEGTVANGDLNGSAVPENPAGSASHAGDSSHPDAAPPTTEHQTLKS